MGKPTLVIMAAGMGSRFGGLKQAAQVGPSGEMILDYSVYDALRAGFGKVVLIINREHGSVFREAVSSRFEHAVQIEYAYQSVDDLPPGFHAPQGRAKPWGTAHAVYSARQAIDGPFAVINADDFYGADAFHSVGDFLKTTADEEKYHYCMAGYHIQNTLTGNGYVSRGICSVDGSGYLQSVTERTHIELRGGAIAYTEDGSSYFPIASGTLASMNMWGFTPSLLKEFEPGFKDFLIANAGDLSKCEYYLPLLVNQLLQAHRADVRVIATNARWYGITYRQDRQTVVDAIAAMVRRGEYPQNLWG